MITLGKSYRDVISGYTGVAIAHVENLSGCNQALLVSQVTESHEFHETWIDDSRLEEVAGSEREWLEANVTGKR